MQTVISKTGIDVCYPCTVHLLHNGENFECEYKSDHSGRDLLYYVCKVQQVNDFNIWGLKFMDSSCMDEQRYWLDLDKLIRPQVKNISPIRFYFRVKVYPPEPYKIFDQPIRHSIYQQLRLDLLGGRLFSSVNDTGMLVALILQKVHGDFVRNLTFMYFAYIKSKILRKERCFPQLYTSTQKRAMEIYQKIMVGLNKLEVEDMFLRLASKLDSYGVEPFSVRDIDKKDILLLINHYGVRAFDRKRKKLHLLWGHISKITHESNCLFVHLTVGGVVVFECVNFSECSYIWSIAVDHLIYFTSTKYLSTAVSAYGCHSCEGDRLSEMSSFIGTYLTDEKCGRIKSDMSEKELEMSCSLLRLIDFNSWKSQLSVLYAVFVLYVMGSQTTVFDELPWVYSLRNCINNLLSKVVFNKLHTI